MKSNFHRLSPRMIFIFASLFLLIACYIIYINYVSKSSIKEGMKGSKIKEMMDKIANDTNPNSTNKNKLIAIQNLLLVSSDGIPTDESINAKKAMIEITQLPKTDQDAKLKALSDQVDIIYPYLQQVYPQFDKAYWKNILTNSVKTNTAYNAVNPKSTITYTFNEQIYNIIQNNMMQDDAKITAIKQLTKRKPKSVFKGKSKSVFKRKKKK